jgi:hypothetical protein
MPAPMQQLISPSDPDARWANKGSRTWVGYKVFLTETGDPDQPRLLTQVTTTPASTADEMMVRPIHADLQDANLLPSEPLMDAGFVRSEHVVDSPQQYGVTVVGPVPSWQAHTPDAFDKRHFAIDGERQVVTCPQGNQSHLWLTDQHGMSRQAQVFFQIACPVRHGHSVRAPKPVHACSRCAHDRIMKQYRNCAHSNRRRRSESVMPPDLVGKCSFPQEGAAAIESQARYRGLRKVHLQQLLTATAINLLRWDAWRQGQPIAPTRHARFTVLLAA